MTRRALLPAFLFAAAALLTPSIPPAHAGAQAPAGPAADEAKRVQAEAIDAMIAKGDVVVLDVREPNELDETGTVKGAIHIPLGQLESRLSELPKDKVILTACRRGGRASRALAMLDAKGFKTAGFCGLENYKGQRVFPKAPAAKG
jgi:rhodanese-related sulfurtransferase